MLQRLLTVTSFIILGFFISGCGLSLSTSLTRQELNLVTTNQKALVIVNFGAVSRSNLGGTSHDHNIISFWYGTHNSEIWFKTENYLLLADKDVEMYVVEPGTYGLSSINIKYDSELSYGFKRIRNFAQFEIKAGEVLYLGDLVTNFKDFDVKSKGFFPKAFSIKDNYQKVQQKLAKQYPQLNERLEKRIIELNKRD